MATANELTINSSASAMDMANAIFGDGIQILSASYTGDAASAGIYSGALTTIPGISPTDSGVILSTGRAADFTNSSGTTDTNTSTGTSTDTAGVDGDAQLTAEAGAATYDGAILQANFIPDGDWLTMQFVFSSEEYPEYVNGGYNDAFGVWVNGNFVPVTVTVGGQVSIDTVNPGANQNLYVSNANDTYNTEMDGFTYVLSFKAPVHAGQVNTIKIGIADAGDTAYDSNLLIMGDSVQTYALAFDDRVQLTPNSSRVFDILANDRDMTDGGLTITKINGISVVPGQTVTLPTGETVTLNANGTVTITSDGDIGTNTLNYTMMDSEGNTDVGMISIVTAATITKDGIVQGTSGDDVIQVGYLGDPDGDLIDANDATGVGGTTGDGDYITAGAGNDIVNAGAGDDQIFGGSGNDSVTGGAGNDLAVLGSGDDTFGLSGDDAGNDTVWGDGGNDIIETGTGNDVAYGGDGNDWISSGADNDSVYGDAGNDTLTGGSGNDVIYGGDDADLIYAGSGDVVVGGEGGNDNDTLVLNGVTKLIYGGGNNEAGTATFTDGTTMSFSEIEHLVLNGGNKDGLIWGTSGNDSIGAGYVDGNGDIIDAGDAVYAGAGPDDDDIFANEGNDTVQAGAGNDNVYGGDGDDSIQGNAGDDYMQGDLGNDTVEGGAGNDFIRGDAGNDYVYGGDGDDSTYGGAGNDHVYGGDGNDHMFGGYGDDTVYGGAGNDVITGSGENDLVYGGTGDDYIQGSNGADTLYGDEGNDTMLGEEDADVFYGGAGDYVDGYETVTTGTDNDTLYVSGVSSVSWDPGNPENGTVFFTGGGQLVFFNIENLYVDGVLTHAPSAPNYIVEGGAGDDLIDGAYTGDPQGDRIDANDNATGTNADLVYAGAGNDTVRSGLGNDTVDAGLGNDVVEGGAGDDILNGEAGNDTLSGDAGNDELSGGDGDDQLDGGTGNDTLYGGGGSDALTDGSSGDDLLSGGDGNDTLTSTSGADTLYGDGGNDVIHANASSGTVTVFGGSGDDSIYGSSSSDPLTGAGDSLSGDDGNDSIFGNGGNDTIDAGSGNDFVDAGDDEDIVHGNDGNDTISGGRGDDTLHGDDGDDSILGGDGNDVIIGGEGADTLSGQNDRDIFFGGIGDVIDGGEGGDDYDTLDLTAYGYAATNIIYDANNHENGTVEFLDNNGAVVGTLTFTNIENVIPCFTPGSLILTETGEVDVADLAVGDRVLTRDSGWQEIRWIGRRDLTRAELVAEPRFNPVRIAKGALGDGLPERDMLVSPQHRMLMTGARAELLFGEHEVLVAATHLVGMPGISRTYPPQISYIHMLFDQHEIVRADGAWSESFQPGLATLGSLEEEQRAEVLALFPDLAFEANYPAARLSLKSREARVLIGA